MGLVLALLWLSWAQERGELTEKGSLMGCAHAPACHLLLLPFYSPSGEEKVGHRTQNVPKMQVVYLEAQGQGELTSVSHPPPACR